MTKLIRLIVRSCSRTFFKAEWQTRHRWEREREENMDNKEQRTKLMKVRSNGWAENRVQISLGNKRESDRVRSVGWTERREQISRGRLKRKSIQISPAHTTEDHFHATKQ